MAEDKWKRDGVVELLSLEFGKILTWNIILMAQNEIISIIFFVFESSDNCAVTTTVINLKSNSKKRNANYKIDALVVFRRNTYDKIYFYSQKYYCSPA